MEEIKIRNLNLFETPDTSMKSENGVLKGQTLSCEKNDDLIFKAFKINVHQFLSTYLFVNFYLSIYLSFLP